MIIQNEGRCVMTYKSDTTYEYSEQMLYLIRRMPHENGLVIHHSHTLKVIDYSYEIIETFIIG